MGQVYNQIRRMNMKTKLIFIDDVVAINNWQVEVFNKIVSNINNSIVNGLIDIEIDTIDVGSKDGSEGSCSNGVASNIIKLITNQKEFGAFILVIDFRWDNCENSTDTSGLECAEQISEYVKSNNINNIKIILVSSKIHEIPNEKDKNIIWCKRPFFEPTTDDKVKPDNGTTTDRDNVIQQLQIEKWCEGDDIQKQIYEMCRSNYIKYQFIGCVIACAYELFTTEG